MALQYGTGGFGSLLGEDGNDLYSSDFSRAQRGQENLATGLFSEMAANAMAVKTAKMRTEAFVKSERARQAREQRQQRRGSFSGLGGILGGVIGSVVPGVGPALGGAIGSTVTGLVG